MSFFKEAARKIKLATSFEDLQAVVAEISPRISELGPPVKECLTVEEAFLEEDVDSTPLLPPDFQNRVPVEIWGDGNCLCSCLSLLQYGYQTRSEEMRVRLLLELVQNWVLYLDPNSMTRGFLNAGPFYIDNLTMYCEDGDYPEDRMKKHLFETRVDGRDLGIFHVAAAASVMRREVYSVYPIYSGHNVRQDIHRKFLPREQGSCKEPAYIFWTNTTGMEMDPIVWKPNHFVVLLQQNR